MQCPACYSASPDGVRFCLHCGHYLGDPDDATRVRQSRPPQTTIRAGFIPATPRLPTHSYEPQTKRRPQTIARLALAALALVFIGGGVTAVLAPDRVRYWLLLAQLNPALLVGGAGLLFAVILLMGWSALRRD